MHSLHRRCQHLAPSSEQVEMCLARQDCETAVRDPLVLVLALIERHVLVHFPLPDINPNSDILQVETPGLVDDNVIQVCLGHLCHQSLNRVEAVLAWFSLHHTSCPH